MRASLSGQETDLTLLASLSFSFAAVVVEAEEVYVTAPVLTHAERNPLVLTEVAEDIIDQLNQIATILDPDYRKVCFGGNLYEFVDGSKASYGVGRAVLRLSARGFSEAGPGVEASKVAAAEAILESDTAMKRAAGFLVHAIDSRSWDDLYRCWEVIEEATGGEKLLKQNGWVYGKELDYFGAGANYWGGDVQSRHSSTPKGDAPKKVLSFDEAVTLMRRLLANWAERGRP